MSCCCCPVTLISILAGLYFIYKFFFVKKNPDLRETNWKKNVVYFYQFPRNKNVPSASPYCLKLETFLRINKIEYENRFTLSDRSKYGRLPYIELNGEQIADSKIIEERLIKEFNVKTVGTAQEDAVALLASRTFDAHTFFVYLHYKIVQDPSKLVNSFLNNSVPSFILPIASAFVSYMFKRKVVQRIDTAFGGIYTDEEYKTLLNKDIESFSNVLGDKKYLCGDKIGTHDCTVFGHLASVYYPYHTYVNDVIDKYPNLVKYMERIRDTVYPDDFKLN